MGEKVTLHLYDLSNGLAAQLSLQLTGKYIPAVWHSAVVVFGEEVYFGQGICRARPGQTHHGLPHKTVDLGETQLDKQTFEEYLSSLSEVYTADKYHLLDFNCNNFTNDVTGFLTGGQIPQDVIDLPKEFLSTPFGASLKPMIDDMFRRSGAGPQSAPASNVRSIPNGIPSGLVQQIAQAAQGQVASSTSEQTNGTHTPQRPVASSLSVAANMASFNSILHANKCVAVMFTGEWCGPCKVVKPVFEDLARRPASQPPVAFVLVDTSAGREVAQHYAISAVPTFKFFLSGKQTHEIKGADAHELKTQVEILAMTGYPAHPHLKLKVPTLGNMSLSPVLYEQKPNSQAALAKLDSFHSSDNDTTLKKALEQARPSLKLLCDPVKQSAAQMQNLLKQIQPLLQSLEPAQFFPLFDILRYAVLQNAFAEAIAESLGSVQDNLVLPVLERSSQEAVLPKASLVTLLRLLCNCFSNPLLGSRLLVDSNARQGLCRILVQALLEADKSVRVAAGSLAYNVAAWLRKQRQTWVDENQAAHQAFEDQEDFEIELCSALLEALDREDELEVAHRLLASLGQLLLFSSYFEAGLSPVMQALEGKRIVQSKKDVLQGNVEAGKLIVEVSNLAES